MAYSELMKDLSRIRAYAREFLVYGFKSREEAASQSLRSYDNEKRRLESWLGEYLAFRQNRNGKRVFFSLDSRRIPCNPLYQGWKSASFTKNDIRLHFILLDILADGKPRSVGEILAEIDRGYRLEQRPEDTLEESTLRKKLREYQTLGLVEMTRNGRQAFYSLAEDSVNLKDWREAVWFFSEAAPLGVVGSFLLDKYRDFSESPFSFKHRYPLFTLDDEILLNLLTAIRARQRVRLHIAGKKERQVLAVPLKIYSSTQNGRQYAAAVRLPQKTLDFFRLDTISSVHPLEEEPEFERFLQKLQEEQPRIWGVSCGRHQLEHLEMVLEIAPEDLHILKRLEREKRCGDVSAAGEGCWLFSADVYDTREMLPWLRTFIGRIRSLRCSNPDVERCFWNDEAELERMYGGDENALQ